MSEKAAVQDPLAAVEAWRAKGAATADPVGFGIVEALARRAAAQEGEARALLVQRVEALIAERAAAAPSVVTEPVRGSGALSALSDLVNRLGRVAPPPSASPVSSTGTSAKNNPKNGAKKEVSAAPPAQPSRTAPLLPLKSVTEFKHTWSRLRAEQRLRQALDQVPSSAGPLNSSHVVNRALQAMHDLSPAYLDAFMSHVDTLQWLEQASGAGDLAPRAAAPTEAKKRPATRAARKTA